MHLLDVLSNTAGCRTYEGAAPLMQHMSVKRARPCTRASDSKRRSPYTQHASLITFCGRSFDDPDRSPVPKRPYSPRPHAYTSPRVLRANECLHKTRGVCMRVCDCVCVCMYVCTYSPRPHAYTSPRVLRANKCLHKTRGVCMRVCDCVCVGMYVCMHVLPTPPHVHLTTRAASQRVPAEEKVRACLCKCMRVCMCV